MQLRRHLSARRPLTALFIAMLVLAPLGCGGGGSGAAVTGKVTLDGKPLAAGQIVFVPANGQTVAALIKSDGGYSAVGVPPGEVKVSVDTDAVKRQIDQAKQSKGVGDGNQSFKGPPPGAAPANMPPEAKEFFAKQKELAAEAARAAKELADNYRPVPDRYKDAKTSGLTFTVKSGTNNFDVPLTSK